MSSRLRIIDTGLIALHPSLGGVTWDHVQYPAGLARLGHDVYYFEDSGQWPSSLDVGKHGHVVGQSGWFSRRSACYLAAGRPVVVQDTGFSRVLPTGEGVLAFTTVDEAAQAIRAVKGDYARHAKAARAFAVEHFDSDKVLTRLLDDAMATQEVHA